jgi:hypothetical protein
VNKPTNSLESIFSAWMPQTAAGHEARLNLMKSLARRFPDVAWRICVAQFGDHHGVGHYSHKPRWRPDGYGFGEPFPTWGPILDFVGEMIEMAQRNIRFPRFVILLRDCRNCRQSIRPACGR